MVRLSCCVCYQQVGDLLMKKSILLMSFLALETAIANDAPQIVDIPEGQSADVFFQINTSGKLYLKVVAAGGESCVDLSWIKWPNGEVQNVGRTCGNATIAPPTTPEG